MDTENYGWTPGYKGDVRTYLLYGRLYMEQRKKVVDDKDLFPSLQRERVI